MEYWIIPVILNSGRRWVALLTRAVYWKSKPKDNVVLHPADGTPSKVASGMFHSCESESNRVLACDMAQHLNS